MYAGNTDGGYTGELMTVAALFTSHQNAVVMLDKNFGGQLPAAVVRERFLTICCAMDGLRNVLRSWLLIQNWRCGCGSVVTRMLPGYSDTMGLSLLRHSLKLKVSGLRQH